MDDFNALLSSIAERSSELKGGTGSGNFGHAGRPGLRGGSADTEKGPASQKIYPFESVFHTIHTPLLGEDIRPWAPGARIWDLDVSTQGVVMKTLDRLVGKYGVPPEGIHLVTHRGGDAAAEVRPGRLLPVTLDEAKAIHDRGGKILKIGRSDKLSHYGLYHDDPTGVTLSFQVSGPKGGKGWFGDTPLKFDNTYLKQKAPTISTGRGRIDDIVTHEFGHILTIRKGPAMSDHLKTRPLGKDWDVVDVVGTTYTRNRAEIIAEAFVHYDAGRKDPEGKVASYLRDYLYSEKHRF